MNVKYSYRTSFDGSEDFSQNSESGSIRVCQHIRISVIA